MKSFEPDIRHLISNSLQTQPLAQFLNSQCPELTQEFSKELIWLGSIYINQVRTIDPLCLVYPDDYVRVHAKPRRFSVAHLDWLKLVKYEDEDYLVCHKPSGVPSHPTLDNRIENCIYQLRNTTGLHLLPTSRLDLPTEGLLLFAKNTSSQTHFNKELMQSRVKKIYRAVVTKVPPLEVYLHHMEKSKRAPKIIYDKPMDTTQPCRLEILSSIEKSHFDFQYQLSDCTEKNIRTYLIEIQLHTGRTHQIRAQLSYLGSPILGDVEYGDPHSVTKSFSEKIALQCSQLEFQNSKNQTLLIQI